MYYNFFYNIYITSPIVISIFKITIAQLVLLQVLRRRERELEHEMERLAREKIWAQQRHASLKKELAAKWDHIDFSKLLPDLPLDVMTRKTMSE